MIDARMREAGAQPLTRLADQSPLGTLSHKGRGEARLLRGRHFIPDA